MNIKAQEAQKYDCWQLWNLLWKQLGSQFCHKLENQLWDQFDNQIRIYSRVKLRNQLRNIK